jgi:hypothetical protein
MSEQEDLQRGLGRVEGKLDAVLEHLKASDERHSKLEPRVRAVENRQFYVVGAAASLAFVFAKVDFTKLVAIAAHASTAVGG